MEIVVVILLLLLLLLLLIHYTQMYTGGKKVKVENGDDDLQDFPCSGL